MKIETLISQAEASIKTSQAAIDAVLDGAKRDNRADLTEVESRQVDRHFGDIDIQRGKLAEYRQVQAEEKDYEARASQTVPADLPTRQRKTASVSVTQNERTYHPGVDAERHLSNSPGGAFLIDVGAAAMGDYAAQERLMRHMQEMRVDMPWLQERANSSTANFSGLVVPAYAVEDAAPAVSAARPMADVMTSRVLPDQGMVVNQSRITTPTAAGIQASENSTVTTQAIDDTILALNVETASGYVQLSRQAVERGLLTQDITVADLLTRVAVALENQMISEATVGLAATATGQTYTNATADTTAVPAFLKQLPQAQNSVDVALLSRTKPCYVVMHPRRFNWLTAAVSSTWPVLSGVSMPVQANGLQLTNDYGPSVRAVMANGMKLVVDGNVTTAGLATALTGGTQDHVYVISAQESYLYEPPNRAVFVRADQPSANQLGILYVAWEYFAYTFGRYTGQSVLINGTGLAAPSFA